MSVSMVDTGGKSFENPAYISADRAAAPSMTTAAPVPDGNNKVYKHKSIECISAWWVCVYVTRTMVKATDLTPNVSTAYVFVLFMDSSLFANT